MKRFALTAAAAGALVLAGCGESKGVTDPPAAASFAITISGDIAGTAQGAAHFGAGKDDDGRDIFLLALSGKDGDHNFLLYTMGTARPAAGSYEFVMNDTGEPPNGKWSGIYLMDEEEVLHLFLVSSGTLTISESSSKRLKGTVSLQAEALVPEESEENVQVTITGSFDAGHAASMASLQALPFATP